MYTITMKRGILLAAFGSGSSQGESTLRRFDAQVRKAFPDVSVRWAFTSMLMRERLASERKKSDSVHKALKKMAFEKFTHVAVQPVHVIPGLEYGDIVSDADELRAGQKANITLAAADRMYAARVASLAPVAEALAAAVRERDPLVLMGTLNGTIRLEHIVEHLRASGRPFDRVWLLPLLAVVGRHTLEDMAGDSEHSWRSRLEAEGIACVPVLRGMMEYQGFMDIWVDNLAQAMKGWG